MQTRACERILKYSRKEIIFPDEYRYGQYGRRTPGARVIAAITSLFLTPTYVACATILLPTGFNPPCRLPSCPGEARRGSLPASIPLSVMFNVDFRFFLARSVAPF